MSKLMNAGPLPTRIPDARGGRVRPEPEDVLGREVVETELVAQPGPVGRRRRGGAQYYLDGVRVVEASRQVHVVVDVIGRAAGRQGAVEERRTSIPGAEVEGARGGLRGGLDGAHPMLLDGGTTKTS